MTKFHPDDVRPIVDINKDTTIQHMHKTLRRQRHPEMFIGLTDDLINMPSFKVNPEIQARFESVFDRDQRENLKIVIHPWFKRVAIFERTWHKGQPLWIPVCLFQDDPKEGHLPPDLVETWGTGAEHLRGKVGAFRSVSYQDLEFVEKCDMRKYGWEQVHEFIAQWDDKAVEDAQKYMDDYLDDFMDYNFWLAMRDAQDHYSQPWSTRDVQLKSDPARWKETDMGGWKMRERVWGEEGDINEMREVAKGNFEVESVSGKAAARILAIKNERYYKIHGVTLYEAATGKKPGESQLDTLRDDSVAYDKENKDQAVKLADWVQGAPIPEEAVSVEEWLLELAKEKVPV